MTNLRWPDDATGVMAPRKPTLNDYPISDDEILGALRELGALHDAFDRMEVLLVSVLRDRGLDWREIAGGTNQSYQNLQKRLRARRPLMGQWKVRRIGRGPSAGRRINHKRQGTETP